MNSEHKHAGSTKKKKKCITSTTKPILDYIRVKIENKNTKKVLKCNFTMEFIKFM